VIFEGLAWNDIESSNLRALLVLLQLWAKALKAASPARGRYWIRLGGTFAGRVAASLLTAIGLPELLRRLPTPASERRLLSQAKVNGQSLRRHVSAPSLQFGAGSRRRAALSRGWTIEPISRRRTSIGE
jgi:hypothetical protein